MNEYNIGIDEELEQEETEKVVTFEEKKHKRPYHIWEVAGEEHKMKLTTAMISKLENKYKKNVLSLIISDDLPPLSVMLTIVQASLTPWEHGTTIDKVNRLYDAWLEEGGSQVELLRSVIMPTLAVSGFFTQEQAEQMMKELSENL